MSKSKKSKVVQSQPTADEAVKAFEQGDAAAVETNQAEQQADNASGPQLRLVSLAGPGNMEGEGGAVGPATKDQQAKAMKAIQQAMAGDKAGALETVKELVAERKPKQQAPVSMTEACERVDKMLEETPAKKEPKAKPEPKQRHTGPVPGGNARELNKGLPRIEAVKLGKDGKVSWKLSDRKGTVRTNDVKHLQSKHPHPGLLHPTHERVAVDGTIYCLEGKEVLDDYCAVLVALGAEGAVARQEGREVESIACDKETGELTFTLSDSDKPVKSRKMETIGFDEDKEFATLLINHKQYVARDEAFRQYKQADKALSAKAHKDAVKQAEEQKKAKAEADKKAAAEAPAKTRDNSRSSSDGKGRTTIFGHAMTAVLRWMGNQGWDFATTKGVLKQLDVDAADNTIRWQLRAGRKEELPLAQVTKKEAEELNALKAKVPATKAEAPAKAKGKGSKASQAKDAKGSKGKASKGKGTSKKAPQEAPKKAKGSKGKQDKGKAKKGK